MVRGVNAGFGIVVIKPCSPDVGVLLNNYVRNAKLAKFDSCTDSSKPRSDNQYSEAGRQFGRHGTGPVHVTVNKSQFLQQHGRVLWGHLFGYTVAHHGHELVVVNLGWQRTGTGAQIGKNGFHGTANFVLNVIGESASFIVKQVGVTSRKKRFAQPFLIFCDLCEAHQQRGYRRFRQC